MIKALKIAISLPREDFERIETIRKKLALQRSAVVSKAIRFWLQSLDEDDLIAQYERGYQKNPESINEAKALSMLSAEAFKEENWK